MSSPWFVVGCGYTGTRLARVLVGQGADLTITRRTAEATEETAGALGARGVRADLSEPATLAGIIPPGAIVVVLAPPGPDPAGEIRGLLAACGGAARIVYVSSTGVYGPARGAWVDESWPLAPITPSGAARVAAEAALAESSISNVSLRVAGIHGPGRGLVDRMRAGTYRIIGNGSSHVSRIHVDDLVGALLACADAATPARVYNVADDDPCPSAELADAAAVALGLPPPARVPVTAVDPETAGMLTADRRVSAARLKRDLGWAPRYPSWRTALAAGLSWC